MRSDKPKKTDQELWQSLAASREVAPGPVSLGTVSDGDLAAWLEGRLPEGEAARIDRAMVADAELRNAALQLSDILGQPLPNPPSRLVVRAQALVGFEAEHSAPRRGFSSFLVPLLSVFALQRAAMASMAIVLAVTGFMMGGGLGESFAQQRQGSLTRPAATADTLSELGDLFIDGI